jgi:hypothetical protein
LVGLFRAVGERVKAVLAVRAAQEIEADALDGPVRTLPPVPQRREHQRAAVSTGEEVGCRHFLISFNS